LARHPPDQEPGEDIQKQGNYEQDQANFDQMLAML
jgi:hypothetical protein